MTRSKIAIIVAYEYWSSVRRWEFLLATFGFPLFMVAISGLAAVPALLMSRSKPTTVTVGVVDLTGQLEFPERVPGRSTMKRPASRFEPRLPDYRFREFSSEKEAKAALKHSDLSSYLVIPRDYLMSGQVRFIVDPDQGKLFDNVGVPPIGAIMVRGILKGKVSPQLLERAAKPITAFRMEDLRQPTQRRQGVSGSSEVTMRRLSRLLLPYGFMFLLVMSLAMSSGYLLRGIADEKESRAIEVLLSSVSAEQLFLGKLLGLSAVGLTQVVVWLVMGLTPAAALLASLTVPWPAVVAAPVLFLLGFAVFGTLMAGLGALGTSWRESHQLSGVVAMVMILPMMFFPLIAHEPSGGLSVFLSLFPFTAPLVMMVRLSVTHVPLGQLVGCLVFCVAAAVVEVKLSVKLFRTSMLLYGKRPSFREVLRWLQEA